MLRTPAILILEIKLRVMSALLTTSNDEGLNPKEVWTRQTWYTISEFKPNRTKNKFWPDH